MRKGNILCVLFLLVVISTNSMAFDGDLDTNNIGINVVLVEELAPSAHCGVVSFLANI
jgi:hypothetical protein